MPPLGEPIILDRLMRDVSLGIRTNKAFIDRARAEGIAPNPDVVRTHDSLTGDLEALRAVDHALEYLPGVIDIRIGDPVPEALEVIPMTSPHRLHVAPVHGGTPPGVRGPRAMAIVHAVAQVIPPIT